MPGVRLVASHSGFDARHRNTLLRALRMNGGIRRGSRLVSDAVRPKRGT